jgi:uncharacterized protein
MNAASPSQPLIRVVRGATEPLLALNNENAAQLSALTFAEFDRLIRESWLATAINDADALLLTFDRTANYDSPNFHWFRERYDRFVYVDRVVTSLNARGKGYARTLYLNLFERARAARFTQIVCEINFNPPNPVSDAFHASLGFSEVGRAVVAIPAGKKTVRYLTRSL